MDAAFVVVVTTFNVHQNPAPKVQRMNLGGVFLGTTLMTRG